jgi:hypothetical protein
MIRWQTPNAHAKVCECRVLSNDGGVKSKDACIQSSAEQVT